MNGKKAKKVRKYAKAIIEKGLIQGETGYKTLLNGQIINPLKKFNRFIKKEI